MEHTKKWLTVSLAGILCLAIVLTGCLLWIRALSDELAVLASERQKLSDSVEDLTGKLNRLEAELKEMIRKSNSLVEELEYTILGPGSQPHTAAYQLTLIPKKLAEDTVVEVTVGCTTVRFSRNGEIFTGTVDIPLFEENEDYPVLTILSAGITEKETLDQISLWHAYTDFLPQLFQSMSGSGSNADPQKTDAYMAYGFRLNTLCTVTPVRFTKITMTQTVNGKECSCQDVTHQLRESDGFAEFYTSLTLSSSDRATVVIRAEDSLGYIHEVTTYCYYEEEHGSLVVTHDDFERIYGPDGTLLYGSPADEDPEIPGQG